MDWCYVNNFEQPYRPQVLDCRPAKARYSARDAANLVETLHNAIPSAFDSDDYRVLEQALEDEFKGRQEQAFKALQQKAQSQGLTFIQSQAGFGFAPTQDGQVVTPETFQQLPEDEQERLKEARFGAWRKSCKRRCASSAAGNRNDTNG